MRNQLSLAAGLLLAMIVAAAQTPASRTPRMPDGKPNLNGIWQTMNTANWDLQTQGPPTAPGGQRGPQAATPPGLGVVEGNEIPYLLAATKTKEQNYANRLALDPETKCYLPGVPRATYMPYPFQILQSAQSLIFLYEYAGAVRNINMGKPKEPPTDSWMGWSNGHWEGDRLVLDVIGFNDQTWLDRAGDFHSDALHVVERYTP